MLTNLRRRRSSSSPPMLERRLIWVWTTPQLSSQTWLKAGQVSALRAKRLSPTVWLSRILHTCRAVSVELGQRVSHPFSYAFNRPHSSDNFPDWTLGPNWPNNGEIDIVEGVNSGYAQKNKNLMSMHTWDIFLWLYLETRSFLLRSPGCTIAGSNETGSLQTNDCDTSVSKNNCVHIFWNKT